jgi:hypothetical protein
MQMIVEQNSIGAAQHVPLGHVQHNEQSAPATMKTKKNPFLELVMQVPQTGLQGRMACRLTAT